MLIAQNIAESGADNAHDHNVVDGHSDVFRVVQRRYRHVTSLPRQEDSDRLLEEEKKREY